MAHLLLLPEEDARLNPLFWPIKEMLVQRFGAKLPFGPLCAFMRSVRDAHHLGLSRDATRKKDTAVCWVCKHWDVAEPMLAEIPRLEEQPHCRETEKLAPFWSEMCRIEKFFEEQNGGKASTNDLLDLARRVAAPHHLRVSRDATRSRNGLLKWYAQHWQTIEGDLIGRRLEGPGGSPEWPSSSDLAFFSDPGHNSSLDGLNTSLDL
jgi:hypothetical protein